MLIESEFKKISKIVEGSRIYFNPNYYHDKNKILSLSPLIMNKTLCYIHKKNINRDLLLRLKQFQEEQFLIPVTISETTLPDSMSLNGCIFRKQLFDEKLFDKTYKENIEEDSDDEELKEIISSIKINNSSNKYSLSDFSFAANWDLFFMQTFNTPMYLPEAFKSALLYKLKRLDTNFYFPQTTINHLETINFLEQTNVIFPSDLTIDQIKRFRKDKAAINFRTWLERKLFNVEDKDSQTKIKYLVQEFSELSKSYEKTSDLIGTSIGGILGAYVEGATGAALGSAIGYGASKVVNYFWREKGPNNWIFLLTEFKKIGSI